MKLKILGFEYVDYYPENVVISNATVLIIDKIMEGIFFLIYVVFIHWWLYPFCVVFSRLKGNPAPIATPASEIQGDPHRAHRGIIIYF